MKLLEQGFQRCTTSQPKYDIGCIQTLIDGLVMASLAEKGKIDLDAPLGEYLPELRDVGSCPGLRIQVKHLLSHATGYHATSGVPEKAGYASWGELVDYLAYTEPAFSPGTVCSWNGLGKTILTPLVERVTGMAYDDLVKREIFEVIGREPSVSNMESGWPAFVIGIEDLVAYIRAELASGVFADLLRRCTVLVVRNPVASRSVHPIGYALGLARYPDGLWGQTGNGAAYNLGIRFNELGTFCTALAIGAPPFARDLVLQYLCTALGFARRNHENHVMGAVLGCEVHELNGHYFGDRGDVISVTVTGSQVSCAFSRDGEHVATVPLTLRDDGILVGDGRWDANQVEFYRPAETGRLVLTFGQIAYAKQETPS